MNALPADWIVPVWSAPSRVRALITTRGGGVSAGPYGAPPTGEGGMNLGLGAGDDPGAVHANRARLSAVLPSPPRWLRQVHGARVVDAATLNGPEEADAAFTSTPDVVAAVMIADCMPVLIADTAGRCVGVAHAGWRGLAAGVVQHTVQAIRERLQDPTASLVAYLGPAIGPAHFDVGPEVLAAFEQTLPDAARAFVPNGAKYRADLFALGLQALASVGVTAVAGGGECTYSDPGRFFSFRRDRVTGRHAALIWLQLAASGPTMREDRATRV